MVLRSAQIGKPKTATDGRMNKSRIHKPNPDRGFANGRDRKDQQAGKTRRAGAQTKRKNNKKIPAEGRLSRRERARSSKASRIGLLGRDQAKENGGRSSSERNRD